MFLRCTANTRYGHTFGTRETYAFNVVASATCMCVRQACNEGNPIFFSKIAGTSSVISVYFFCHAISTCWPIGAKYKFISQLVIGSESPFSLCLQRGLVFLITKTIWRVKVGTRDYRAHNLIMPTTNKPVTSIYCVWLVRRVSRIAGRTSIRFCIGPI